MEEKIEVSASVNAEIKKVWEYYANPKHIINWNFANDDWCCPTAENELNVGGKFKSSMEAKDGSLGFEFEGTYTEIETEKTLVYQMGGGRSVSIMFKPNSSATQVEVSFDAEADNSIETQKNGWQAILNNFKKYTEGN